MFFSLSKMFTFEFLDEDLEIIVNFKRSTFFLYFLLQYLLDLVMP